MTYASEKEASDACAGCFIPPAYTILDLTGYVRLSDDAVLRAGLFNVTDETYWQWSDVRGLSAASTVRDAYSHPGRNFSISVSYRF
ncbi:MAG: TonB-dependent receptor [Hyphomonadaceae bacterium]|nr:TonB-dependent receptor [Hyphomonadaceae bacterium]